jgi:type IV fimbrial biogenesis protein FimT
MECFLMPVRNGFSLIELLVVIAIVAILAMIAIPSFQGMTQRGAIVSQSNAILGFLQLARSEAATRRAATQVCPSDNQTSCSGTDLARGGIMLQNGAVIKVLSPAVASITSAGSNTVTFNTDGTSNGAAAWVVSYTGSSATSKAVSISIAGRATIGDTL